MDKKLVSRAVATALLSATLVACGGEDTGSDSTGSTSTDQANQEQQNTEQPNEEQEPVVLPKAPSEPVEEQTPDPVPQQPSEETNTPPSEEQSPAPAEPSEPTTEPGDETTPPSEEQTPDPEPTPQEPIEEPAKNTVRVETAIHQDFIYANSQLQDLALIGSGNEGILFTSVADTSGDSAKVYTASTYSKSNSVDFTQWASLSTTDDISDVTPFAIGEGRFYAYCQENNGNTEFVVRQLGRTDALLIQPSSNRPVDIEGHNTPQTYKIDQCRGLSDITTEAHSNGSTVVRLFVATQQVNVNSAIDNRSEIMQMSFVMSQNDADSTWSAGSAAWGAAKGIDAWEVNIDRILDIELEQTGDNQYMLYVAKYHYGYGVGMSNRVFAYRYYANTNRLSELGNRIFNNPWGNPTDNWQVTDMEAIDGTLYVTSQSDGIAYANFAKSSQEPTTPTSMEVPTAGQVCSGGIAWNGVAVADGNDARFYCGSAQDKKNVISVSINTLLDSESSNSGSESSDTGSGNSEPVILPQGSGD